MGARMHSEDMGALAGRSAGDKMYQVLPLIVS